jgi:hypothetical protein
MKSFLAALILILFYSCSGTQHVTKVECNTVVCDTIDNYVLSQFCKDTTIIYNLTYTDSIKLKRLDGDLAFKIIRCQSCKGIEYVNILTNDEKLIQEVVVRHNKSGGESEKFTVDTLKAHLDPYVKVNWFEYGKVFYITK